MKKLRFLPLVGALTTAIGIAHADEGMWTFDHLPIKQMQERYGFTPSPEWISHIERSTVRLAGGCSGSFVSADGLVMTNHHCANTCLSQLSDKTKDYMDNGFAALKQTDEPKCPDVELNQLDSISDITAQVNQATAGKSGDARIKAMRAVESTLQQSCINKDAKTWRCDIVSLYHGGRYALYKYRRFQDVRLVFAPEQGIAFFGGDPDNFNFPRYDLDVTFFRAYVNDKPAKTPNFLQFRVDGPKANEMTFVVGNPGSTSRQLPWQALQFLRDKQIVPVLFYLSELRGVLWEYSRMNAQQAQQAQDMMFGIENSLKAYKGRLLTLTDQQFIDEKQREDAALRQWISSDPQREKQYGSAWATLEKSQQAALKYLDPYNMIVAGRGIGFGNELFSDAIRLVLAAKQRTLPDAERVNIYREANLPALEQALTSDIPVYPQFEQTLMAWSMEKMRQILGPDNPLVLQLIGKQSTDALAKQLVSNTRLADVALRKQLWEGGEKAITASKDPMIVFARQIEPVLEKVREQYEDEVEAPSTQANELIAQARFARDGTASYPDATFSPRLSFGKVVGWQEGDHQVPPFTYFDGLYKRATNAQPFLLPQSWIRAKSSLALQTPFDFVTNNDIIGGNSGSPVIDKQGHAVGLIFDGNIESLGGDYVYNEKNNRAVAVDTAALIESLRSVYHLQNLTNELINGKL